MLRTLYLFFVMPGFLFTAFMGLLATWVDRKLAARVQWRKGPPWFQPFADILKLLGKETCVPSNSARAVFLSAPLFGLAAVTLVSTMVWMFNFNTGSGFIGDLIVVIYLLTVPSLALMVGGSASGNPLSAIGSSREMKLMLAYELPFLIAVLTVASKARTLLLGGIVSYQSGNMVVMSLSGLIAFVVCLVVVQAKLGFSPFDIAEAEQEIMGGPLLEYSGTPLAEFRLTKAMLLFTLPALLITLFLGGIDVLSWTGILLFLVKYVIILVLLVLIKNTNPRLRIDQAVMLFWGPVTALAAIGFVLALIGL